MNEAYAIKTSTLTALGDAIRKIKEEEKILSWSGEFTEFVNEAPMYAEIEEGKLYRLTITFNELSNPMGNAFNLYVCGYMYDNTFRASVGDTVEIEFEARHTGDVVKLKAVTDAKYSYTISQVDNDYNVVENTYTVAQMVEELNNLPPMISQENLKFTGTGSNRFGSGWEWFIDKYGSYITTEKITSMEEMFRGNLCEYIPFTINTLVTADNNMSYAFYGCRKLIEPPKIKNARVYLLSHIFENCTMLKEIPDDYCDTWDWSLLNKQTSGYTVNCAAMFAHCEQLRRFPKAFFKYGGNPYASYSYSTLYQTFTHCYRLEAIEDMPLIHTKASTTSNAFYYFCDNCSCLKKLTFAPLENGQGLSYSNQTLDLSNSVGWGGQSLMNSNPYGYTSAETRITDDDTYYALKYHINSWTTDVAYSRYNLTSAVETINSLPTLLGTGNVIKFKGEAGSKTDGGAINTMTDAQIAVAAAKGWTVSFV